MAIKVKVDKIKMNPSDEGFKFRVKLNTSYSSQQFVINGEPVNCDTFTFDELPDIKVQLKRQTVSHYENVDDSSVMSVEDYTLKNKELYKEYFSSIDEEYSYKKFAAQWKAVYKEVVTLEDVETEMYGTFLIETGNKYVTSDYFIGQTTPVCKFDIHSFMLDTFKKICIEEGCEPGKSEYDKYIDGKPGFFNPVHSGLRYARIAGNYIFDSKYELKDKSKCAGKLQDHLLNMEKIETDMRAIIQRNVRALQGTLKLSNIEIINEINALREVLYGLDVKKASITDKQVGIRRVNELLGKL